PATSTVLLNVNPAPLTVTAEDVTRAYGQDNPAFATTYHGLVNGDTPDSLGLAPSFSTPAGPASPPGTYPLTPMLADPADYKLTVNPGHLVVTPAVLSPVAVPVAAAAGTPFGGGGADLP